MSRLGLVYLRAINAAEPPACPVMRAAASLYWISCKQPWKGRKKERPEDYSVKGYFLIANLATTSRLPCRVESLQSFFCFLLLVELKAGISSYSSIIWLDPFVVGVLTARSAESYFCCFCSSDGSGYEIATCIGLAYVTWFVIVICMVSFCVVTDVLLCICMFPEHRLQLCVTSVLI